MVSVFDSASVHEEPPVAHGPVPTIDDFAAAIVAVIDVPAAGGHTFLVGGHDYLTTAML